MTGVAPLDRRRRRRQETIEQVLEIATSVMTEQGVTGLSLGEVARRLGIRPPSLYVYFDSKNALYEALFERGWRLLLAELTTTPGTGDPVGDIETLSTVFVRWAVEHPAYAPLMFWRPVPAFTPSAAAYAPASEVTDLGWEVLRSLRDAGGLSPDVDLEHAFRAWTALTTGVITQQLANAPGEPFETGVFTGTLPDLLAMWLAHYRTATRPHG
jgi:AcrR family transcriptional regulator